MLKECLQEITNHRLDLGDKRKNMIKIYLEKYDENALYYILSSSQGLKSDDIYIYFYPGVGFRCSNDISKVGKLPMCNTFQNILNKKYQELINTHSETN